MQMTKDSYFHRGRSKEHARSQRTSNTSERRPPSDLFPPGGPHFLKILQTPKVGPLASTELSKTRTHVGRVLIQVECLMSPCNKRKARAWTHILACSHTFPSLPTQACGTSTFMKLFPPSFLLQPLSKLTIIKLPFQKKKKLSFGILPTALPSAPAKSLGNQVDNTWTIAAGTVITKVITHWPSSSLCLAGSDASRHSILLARMVSSCYQKWGWEMDTKLILLVFQTPAF